MKNIVVGVADTETSQVAGRQAFDLAEHYGSTVHVVTAVDAADPISIQVGSDRFVLNDVDIAQSAITAFVQSIKPTVDWEVHTSTAKPAKALLDVAERVNADLIVVGNVRMQGFGRVLGSVGGDVLQQAPCNVLIVKTV